MSDWWYSFECPGCPASEPRESSGVVVEVRLPGEVVGHYEPADVVDVPGAWRLRCPLCGRDLDDVRGRWRADEDGFGGRGDSDDAVNLVRAVRAFERESVARLLEARAEHAPEAVRDALLSAATGVRRGGWRT